MINEFQLFPDIKLVCSDSPITAGKDELVICCCASGVCEYHIENRYYYLTEEIILAFNRSSDKEYPACCSSDFRGLFLIVGSHYNNDTFTDLFGISNVLYINENKPSVYIPDERYHDMFEAILAGADRSLMSFIRLKILELFMLLSENEPHQKKSFKVLQAGDLICENVSEHYTIEQLSGMFRINQTTLKNEFKRTYGSGIYAYVKKRKMFRAAELLTQTDMKIIDIAEEVGYWNASKFAKAFQSVMGTTPKHFRTEHKYNTEIESRLGKAV